MNKNILVSEVPGGGGGCTVGISSPRTIRLCRIICCDNLSTHKYLSLKLCYIYTVILSYLEMSFYCAFVVI